MQKGARGCRAVKGARGACRKNPPNGRPAPWRIRLRARPLVQSALSDRRRLQGAHMAIVGIDLLGGGIQRRARATGAQPVWRVPYPQRGKRGQGRPRRGGSHRPRTAGDAAPGYRRALQAQDGHRRGVQPGREPLHAGSAVRVRHRPAGGGRAGVFGRACGRGGGERSRLLRRGAAGGDQARGRACGRSRGTFGQRALRRGAGAPFLK